MWSCMCMKEPVMPSSTSQTVCSQHLKDLCADGTEVMVLCATCYTDGHSDNVFGVVSAVLHMTGNDVSSSIYVSLCHSLPVVLWCSDFTAKSIGQRRQPGMGAYSEVLEASPCSNKSWLGDRSCDRIQISTYERRRQWQHHTDCLTT